MMKHLFWYPWLMGMLVLAIAVCAGLIIHELLFPAPQPILHPGTQLVQALVEYAAG